MKRIVSANITRLLEFDTQDEMEAYLDELERRNKKFNFSDREIVDGKYRVTVREQYNDCELYF